MTKPKEPREFDIDAGSRDEMGFYDACTHEPDDPFWDNIHVIEKTAFDQLMQKAERMAEALQKLKGICIGVNGEWESPAWKALEEWEGKP